MQKTSILLFIIALVFTFTTCNMNDTPSEPVITVQGTVTIRINGEPWNGEGFHLHNTMNARNGCDCYLRWNRPAITAYSKGGQYIGEVIASNSIKSEDSGKGIYYWTMKIPAGRLPDDINFLVTSYIQGVSGYGWAPATEYFWIDDKDTIIDLGVFDYNVIQLSGNLPITINNEPLDKDIMGFLHFSNADFPGSFHDTIFIEQNGNWSCYMFQPHGEISAAFMLEVPVRYGGIFRKALNPDDVIIIYDTDMEIAFPNYPSINFEAITLSGKLILPEGNRRRLHIYVDEGDTGVPAGPINQDKNIVRLEITWPETGKDNIYEWEILLPFSAFPYTITTRVELLNDVKGQMNVNWFTSDSVIIIKEDTDLNNINLGVLQPEKKKNVK